MVYITDTEIGQRCFFGHKSKQSLGLGVEMKEVAEKEKNAGFKFNVYLPPDLAEKIKQEAEVGMMSWSTRIRQIIGAHYERVAEKVEAR